MFNLIRRLLGQKPEGPTAEEKVASLERVLVETHRAWDAERRATFVLLAAVLATTGEVEVSDDIRESMDDAYDHIDIAHERGPSGVKLGVAWLDGSDVAEGDGGDEDDEVAEEST